MAILQVNRRGHFLAMARKYKIFLNNEVVGEVKNNNSIQLEVPAGTYQMKTGISALSGISPTIDVQITDAQEAIVETGPNNLYFLFLLLAVIGGGLIGASSASIVFLIIGIPLAVVAIYLAFKMSVEIKQVQ